MPKVKITVLRKLLYEDLAREYRSGGDTVCELFEEGQEFVTEDYGPPPSFPCPWAWHDLYKYFATLKHRGAFDHDMKPPHDKAVIACCTDGVRPVIFRLERVDD